MHFSRSFCLAAAFLSSLPAGSQGRATTPKQLRGSEVQQDVKRSNGWGFLNGLFGKRLVAQTCILDEYLVELQSLKNDSSQRFCNAILELPPRTVDVDVTSTRY